MSRAAHNVRGLHDLLRARLIVRSGRQLLNQLSVRPIVQAHDPLFAAGRDDCAIGGHADCIQEVSAARELSLRAAAFDVPHPN